MGQKRRLAIALVLLGFQSLLSACAPPSGAMNARRFTQGESGTTGFANSEGRPYTLGGDPRTVAIGSLSSNRNSLGANTTGEVVAKKESGRVSEIDELPKTPTPAKSDLGSSIQGVQIVRYRLDGRDKIMDRLGQHSVQVKLTMANSQTLTFEGALEKRQEAWVGLKLSGPTGYQGMIDFHDLTENNESLAYFRLSEVGADGKYLNQAEIFGRSFSARVRIEPLSGSNPGGGNLTILNNLRNNTFAWVSNTVVMKGRSFYQVSLLKSPSGEADEIDRLLQRSVVFAFSGDSLRSSILSPSTAKPNELGLFRPLKVELIGDAEDTPERTFSVTLQVPNEKNPLEITMWVLPPGEKAVEPTPPANSEFRGVTRLSFLPVNLNEKDSRAYKMAQDFESTFSLKGVQNWIEKYKDAQSQKAPRVGLVRALNNAEPFREILTKIFEFFDVAPPAALLSIIESPFFTSDGYPIRTAPSSTATGPMQLLAGSALSLGLKVANNKIGIQPPYWDERNFLVPSACGAARHLDQSLQSVAAHDHVIAVLAYYMGDARASNTIAGSLGHDPGASAVEKVLKYRVTFRQVSTQHMVEAKYIEYVYKVLALYFVTGNPQPHNLGWKDGTLSLAKGKIIPANGMNDPLCTKAVLPVRDLLKPI